MDCQFMLETSTPSVFKNLKNGKLYNELHLHMIQGCLNDELDEMYEGWNSPNGELQTSGSTIIKNCFPEQYWKYTLEYCERNEIIHLTQNDIHRYFEPKED